MLRVFLIVLGVAVLGLAGGFAAIGMFPSTPPAKPIEKVLPNDRFQGR